MSPEVTNRLNNNENFKGYGEEVDWWSLGCVFFELVIGVPPFDGNTPHEIFSSINNWENIIPQLIDQCKDALSSEFVDLLQRYLSKK